MEEHTIQPPDIRDFEKLKTCIETINPEIIFHLAAQPLVRHSYKETLETFNTNIIGTANIFEIAVLTFLSVFASTFFSVRYRSKEFRSCSSRCIKGKPRSL